MHDTVLTEAVMKLAPPGGLGVEAVKLASNSWAFVATPLRALADMLYLNKSVSWPNAVSGTGVAAIELTICAGCRSRRCPRSATASETEGSWPTWRIWRRRHVLLSDVLLGADPGARPGERH